MPIFEYVCKECEHQFETLVFGKQKPCARSARAKAGAATLRVCGFGEERGGDSVVVVAPGPGGACGDARGPGACSARKSRLSPFVSYRKRFV
jgi:putative FmdB family regulatory protein